MFCNQCGARLPEGSKFCSSCGANLTAAPAAAPKQPAAGTKAPAGTKPPKKKSPVWVTILIVLAAFLLGKFVIAPSMLSEPDETTANPGIHDSDTSGNGTGSDASVSNPAYDSILTEAYIVHFQPFFMMDTESFVLKQADGIICCVDYGYENDVVKQWVETMYVPVSDYTDDQKADLETTMKAQFEALDALSCCSVEFKMGTNYLTITCTYTNVDTAEGYGELYSAGLLNVNTHISMSATRDSLVEQGFIQK